MKTSQIFIVCFLITIEILLPGCKRKAILPPMPDMGIQEEEINSRILLEAPEGWNTLKSGDIISLTVSVISDDQIA